MKIKIILPLVLSCFLLSACSFGGFKPPIQADVWYMNHHNFGGDLNAYLDKEKKDMKACGMDFVIGESDNAKVNLCLENKGYHLKGGPVCESKFHWDDSICIDWRRKHSKPNAQPWG